MKKTLLLLGATVLLSSATCCRKDNDIPEPAALPAACLLVPDQGMCNAAMVRYYFDPIEKKCKPFTWGGCNGVVPFVTLQECLDCGCER
ncbi:BPTI/Kunitz domain-containing protein [Hymenobacter sediminicola]|uniref:Proteinase inhibitor I4 serpin n=1 Tax=Hymenobacter sediminicola TaxID=2761579 RepID=A0A7G7W9V6_9BACT|nr:BPTI/Kunitz domain-containing protein [Hymenobacter sediminicola]QNH63149.1 proteinase inhibitor I4 serpin [Hymenobacter sediminicola]